METQSPAQWLAETLTAKFKDEGQFSQKVFSVSPGGRKFERVVQDTPGGGHASVHCFVEKSTGHVYKADGWKSPAKGVRFTSVKDAATAANIYGGHLYAK